ncbi:hypothetical protein RUND412_007436 [Rhizina undulata]
MQKLLKASILAFYLSRTVAGQATPDQAPAFNGRRQTNVALFPFETVVLTEKAVENYPELQFANGTVASAACKILPSDSTWPSQSVWNVVNSLTGNALISTVPSAASCYNDWGVYDASQCTYVTNEWSNSDFHELDPTSIMSPFFEGNSCLPTDDPTATCALGGYPNYVINASSVLDIQVAVNLARNLNMRLVVKNTGHDFSGKSSGANSLSVWTHWLKEITYYPSFSGFGYSGPAFKVGTGIQGFEIYEAAYAQGLMVVGGEGVTVGFAGGYIQGGGHSPLSSLHGMAADQVLQYEVVTADGQFVTANANTNSDLFWALRGGGGSTFGVVTSVVVKAYKDVPVTTVNFSFSYGGSVTEAAFWQAIRAYMTTFPTMVDSGVYSYFKIFGNTFYMAPFFAPNLSVSRVNALLQPFYDELDALDIPYTPNVTTYSSFYPAWSDNFPQEAVGQTNLQTGSRLFPRSNFEDETTFNATVDAIQSVIEAGISLVAFNMAPTLAAGGNANNSVNPAWRTAVMHAIGGAGWATNATESEIQTVRNNFTYVQLQEWRDVTPGGGCYLGESDINEPDFQQAFYGSYYEQLYDLKQQYDPYNLFYAPTAVGSENWIYNNVTGTLCPSS